MVCTYELQGGVRQEKGRKIGGGADWHASVGCSDGKHLLSDAFMLLFHMAERMHESLASEEEPPSVSILQPDKCFIFYYIINKHSAFPR